MNTEDVKNLIKSEFETINAEDTISKLVPLLEKFSKPHAILVEEDGVIVGVVRERDLIRSSAIKNPEETKVKSTMIRTGILSIEDLDPEKVARRFVEDSTPFVVVKLGKEYGTIYIDDFLLKLKDDLSGVKVADVMNPEVYTVSAHASAAKALATMRNYGVERLVVVDENNKVIGIITAKDILDRVIVPKKRARFGDASGEKEKTLAITVESIMSSPPITVQKIDSISEAIQLMVENNISSLPVTKDGMLEGILVKKDILEYYLKKVEIGKKDFAVQIITSDIKIDEFDRDAIMEDVEKLMRKFSEFLGESYLFVYIKRHKEKFRGLPLIHVRLKLSSSKGNFMVTGESWGVEYAFHVALRKLEREVLKEKELMMDKKMLKRFYEEVFEVEE